MVSFCPDRMHLRLTDEDLKTMLEMMSLAMWAVSFNRKESATPGIMRYDDMLQRLFKKATETGLSKHIEWNPERQGHCFTKNYEDKAFFTECYDEFRNESFWEELVTRLIERDLMHSLGKAKYNSLSDAHRQELAEPLHKRYWDELMRYGAENFHLISSPHEG